ncbi:uncharacterized protein LOC103524116 [Trichonephila clavipes]|nr:uncharacterized protein LOC103524116 [Trichonephila clavipes]
MITGEVKTTPVLAMQLLCDLQPFTNIIEKNAAILFNRLIRLPNNSFWRDYDSDGGRNLKTQKGFIQCVRENIQYKIINDVPFELLSFANPLDNAILDIRLDLVLNVRKRDLSPTALHAIALETINTRFPPEEWLHIYTDGSLLDFAQGAGIGVFSHLFSFYLHAGPLTTHFDELCRELLGKIKGKIVFQWVPSHCGLWGNQRADFLAKKGMGILQNFRRDLTLHSAKLEIKRIFRESFRLTASSRDKPWSTLCKKSHGIPSSPRAAAVAKFRLLTGHDCLCALLFRFNLVTSPIYVLCDTGQDMTAAHLDECSALNDLKCICKPLETVINGHEEERSGVEAMQLGTEHPPVPTHSPPTQRSLAHCAQIKNTGKLIKIKEIRIMYLQDLIEIETFDKYITECCSAASNIEEHRAITTLLKQKGEEFYTIPSPVDRPLQVIIKGLPSTSIEDIKRNLTEQGVPVIKVAQLTQRKSKFPLPIFMVEVRKNAEDAMDIYDVSKCCYMSIVIDPFKKRPGATQFYNCNYFNHTSAKCEMKPRCSKCSKGHRTGDCPIKECIEISDALTAKRKAIWQTGTLAQGLSSN